MSSSARVPDATRIENLCIAKFNELPKTGKPLIDKEWTVLSCILQWNSGTDALDVVALGTGLHKYIQYRYFNFLTILRSACRYQMHWQRHAQRIWRHS